MTIAQPRTVTITLTRDEVSVLNRLLIWASMNGRVNPVMTEKEMDDLRQKIHDQM